jgi:alpha-amylase
LRTVSGRYGNRVAGFHSKLDLFRDRTPGWLGDETVALPDLNTESDYVVSEFKSWLKDLVSNYSIDSLRIDTVKHVRQDFWPSFIAEGGVFAVGEVLDGGVKYVAGYQNNSMDSVFNYPVYFPLV